MFWLLELYHKVINVVLAWNAENCYFVQNWVFCIQSITIFSETQTSKCCKQSILKRKPHNNTSMKTTFSNNILMSALCCFSTAWWLSSGLMTLGIQWITDGLSYLSHTWYHRCHDGFLMAQCDIIFAKRIYLTVSFFLAKLLFQTVLIDQHSMQFCRASIYP